MRKNGRTRHYIRYLSCVMAAVLGLLQPCAAMAVENHESEVSDTDSQESKDEIIYITAFEPLAEEDAYFPCVYKPTLEELVSVFPETLSVRTEGEEASIELEVVWECEEDFDETALEQYVFYPKWDEKQYALADVGEEHIEIPAITVEVPADSGMIHDLEEASSDLQDISRDKSILALVYLCDKYEVKDTPNQDGETIHTVVCGQSVQITDVALDENGAVWYRVILYLNENEYTGYIEREYLATSDEEFARWEETY
ncbi:MAG: SH3 domain-containing protein, partial [Lachnospiraceae bacterium]|nr:SH3 domain-containing protein [Lachnospiraceae bacterium]